MSNLLQKLSHAVLEGFTNPSGAETHRKNSIYAEAIVVIVAFLISIAIISLVGLWLWNNSIVPLFTFARPAKSVFEILGLMIFLMLIHP
jgi:hypothetical protein